ncbi:MAG: 50S ribosome-binding GTPase, partial [Chloroflexi bacterium]|nr:50S ribosome-binding GTPase [Chloroflexota bacterium]
MSLPVVAIVGRPNVGKSTLFNRILGRRTAIVEDKPGTTRDRVYGQAHWQERDFSLVDTGGLDLMPTSDVMQQVKDQVEVAITEADVILFLVDAKEGVVPSDQEIAQALRRSGKKVILVVNKADNPQRLQEVPQFYQLALGDPMAISAYHGLEVGDLLDKVVKSLPPQPSAAEEPPAIKIAIVGRPNVGKSL